MFDHWRTPFLAILYGLVIGTATMAIVEMPARPLTPVQRGIFYLLSCMPGLGLALLGDPAAKRAKATYIKIDFYAGNDATAEEGGPAVPGAAVADGAGRHRGRRE